jgi:hypothetical protein
VLHASEQSSDREDEHTIESPMSATDRKLSVSAGSRGSCSHDLSLTSEQQDEMSQASKSNLCGFSSCEEQGWQLTSVLNR